ncbi:MAG TPA: universal stress protein [Planctomycetota bacterium]|jgi:nucleotide-binding universal stress UspA family protein|nr:universal stress protein [Planctomycetota bacterium]
MFQRVLLPLDGSPVSEAIFPYLRPLVRRSGVQLFLVRAVTPAAVEPLAELLSEERGAAERHLASVAERLTGQGFLVRTFVRVGAPLRVISDVAAEEYADLVAMSTHGRTGIERALFGSVTERVLRESVVPVLAIRPLLPPRGDAWAPGAEHALRTVLVPLDGSGLARGVLPWVRELASIVRARVVLLRVVEPGPAGAEREEAERDLSQAARLLAEAAVATETLVEEGDPATMILATARRRPADLIAMTTHGRTGLARLAAGSVTERVLRGAGVPVLALRPSLAAVTAVP